MNNGDQISYLLENGMTSEEIHRYLSDGISMDELCAAAERCIARGDPISQDPTGIIQQWENPEPFSEVKTPDFPIESLPGCLSAFVECLAESTQTPEEMAGVLSLGVLATAFQSKFAVEITPDWKEPLCLYTVAVAAPGERKSAVISALTKPLQEWEAEQRELEAEEIARNRMEREFLEASRAAAKTKAVKKSGGETHAEMMEIAAKLANFKDRHPYRLLADDSTPEKLVDMLDEQGGCLTVCSAEGGVFDSMTGRYEKTANFDVYLKAHSGDMIKVDRIGRSANCIRNPRLTMILTIQPDVLRGLMANSALKGRGLCGRFLFSVCNSKVGYRKICPEPIPDKVKRDYRDLVRRIIGTPYSGIIRLSPEADMLRQSYQGYVETKLGAEWEEMRDWAGKLTGAMVRIAALIHAAEVQGDPAQTLISHETMTAATNVAEFLSHHAEAAYQLMGGNADMENAKYVLKRISASGKDSLSRSELTRLCRGRISADDLQGAVDTLIGRHYLREIQENIGYNGRFKTYYLVNPAVYT